MSEKKPDSETTEERLSEKISIQTEEIKAEIQDKRESAEDTAEPSAAEPENAEETKSAEETGSAEESSVSKEQVQEEELQTQIDAEKERSEEITKLKKYVNIYHNSPLYEMNASFTFLYLALGMSNS